MEEKIKKIDYFCNECKYAWSDNYPLNSKPPAVLKCPKCKLYENHRKPYNFFEDLKNNPPKEVINEKSDIPV